MILKQEGHLNRLVHQKQVIVNKFDVNKLYLCCVLLHKGFTG